MEVRWLTSTTPDKMNVREDTDGIATHVASDQQQDALERDAMIKKTYETYKIRKLGLRVYDVRYLYCSPKDAESAR